MKTTTKRRGRPPRSEVARFLTEGATLLAVLAGYKAISLAERWQSRLEAFRTLAAPVHAPAVAETRRHAHNLRSAWWIHDTAVRNQGLLIKTAQFLSGRPDVVPDEYVDVLSRLQDEVPPEPFAVIRREVERELGQPLEAIFSEFGEEPVASASLAQVHRAVLRDGHVAAVKVQYPGIDRVVDIDLRNNARFVRLLNRLDSTMDFHFITEEMNRMIPLELDFINEGHNAERIAANFAGVEDIVVPRIYWEHTTRKVLTMEFVEGVKITDVEGMARLGVDPRDVAKILVVAFGEMLLTHGVFHADPHPGNLLVAPGPKLVLVDFGQVKEIGPAFRVVFAQMTRALMKDDVTELGLSFRNLGFRMKTDAAEGYEGLGNAYVGNIAKRMRASDAGWVETDEFRDSYRDVLRILRNNPMIKIPPDLLFVGRVMGLLNGLSMTLRSPTNLLIEMSRMLDEAGGGLPQASAAGTPRKLLEA